MADKDATTDVTAEFTWPSPNLDQLKAVIVGGVIEKFLSTTRMLAQHTENKQWKLTKTFHTLNEWLPNLSASLDRVSVTFWGNLATRSLDLNWEPPLSMLRVHATVIAGDTAEAELTALLEGLRNSLGLRPRMNSRAEQSFLNTSASGAWAAPAIAIAKEIAGAPVQFWGNWDESEIRRETKIEDDWLPHIPTAQRWWGTWSGRGHRLSIDFQGPRNEVRVQVDSWDGEHIGEMLERFKSIPGLKPRILDAQKQGDFRKYFLSKEATIDWYDQVANLLESYAGKGALFWGRVARGGQHRSLRGYGSYAMWRDALKDGMAAEEVERSYVSFHGTERGATFDLDHVRDLLSLDVQCMGGQDVDQMHLSLAKDLGLTPAPDDAYRYRQWGRTYEIKWADSTAFANRLESGFKALFRGRRTALKTGTLHIGSDEEKVETFADLNSLISELKKTKDKDLSELHLVADGPRGEFMGVHVEKNKQRLRLLAFVEFDRFKAFASDLGNGLDKMKLRESYDDQTSTAPTAEKKPGWLLTAAGLLVTLATGFFGNEVYKAMREPAELTVDYPTAKEGIAQVQSHDLTMSWTYKEPRIFGHPRIDGNHEALVDVTRQEDGKPLMSDERKFGKVRVSNLSDGAYSIRVRAGETYKAFVLNVGAKPEEEQAHKNSSVATPKETPKTKSGKSKD